MYASSLLSDLGAMVGLGVTSTVGDCMCRVEGCADPEVCTFEATLPIAPGAFDCGRGPIQDQQALLKIALGCR